MRIMVVEDEPPILRDICAQIQTSGSGYTIVAKAVDGESAIKVVKDGLVPDLVITDIRMPIVDGIALAEWLHEEYPRLPMVILTGYKEFEYARSALRLGVVDYLLKPVVQSDLTALLRKMEKLVAERQYEDWINAVENAWNGGAVNEDAGSSHDVGLVIMVEGELCDSCGDFLLPLPISWEKIDLDGRLDELVGNGRRWIGTGQSPNEKILILDLEGKPPGWLESALRALYESLAAPAVSISMAAYETPLGISLLRAGYAGLRRALSQRSVIGRSRLVVEPDFSPAGQMRVSHEDLLAEAEAFLRRHFTEGVSGEQLSKKIGIGPSYLSRQFKRRTGYSPPEFLIQLRVERARELLDCSETMRIKDVAHAVGYVDPNHFSRIFHRVSGFWPSEYRNRAKDEEVG